ncbi:T9SS type A sorting domain-containing protein [Algoriphagus sp. C2-6-M1]|uniref:T9SS type A sorting domain-containing protein n=1 Tax=Algoriphagus persicinus TaxID=3108754 RepID=UPI002B3826AA|nr:T9SS type A sorting domain-containing protein [Algoriphagus sp. C2-6-M1]MEB2781766.1 T9SS type A sorting domain-containing protein [Algoriphagus sp. C2-6-M1]
MKKQVLFIVSMLVCVVLASLKPTEVNPFRIYPYLQAYGKGKIQLTWFSNSQTESSIKLTSATGSVLYEGAIAAESVPEIYYTEKEKSQVLEGLEQGSWIGTDQVFRYRYPVDLPADTKVNYVVTVGGVNYSGDFTMPSSKTSWEKIRFIALADSETDPRGRVTNRAWYPGSPLVRPITTIPELWKEKFGTTTEHGIELPNYFLTEEKGYAENLNIIKSREPNFIIMPGDLVQGAGYQPAWDEFFRQNAGISGSGLSSYAIIPALGNWEAYGGINGEYGINEKGDFVPVLGRKRFHAYFETPTEDPLQKHRQSYYRVDYGPVTILTLDSSNGTPDQTAADFDGQTKLTGTQFTVPGTDTQEHYTQAQYNAAGGNDLSSFGPGSDQYIWLEENLKNASENGQLIFVQYHHIAFSSGEHGVPMNHELSIGQVGTPMRILNPILEEYGVIAVFSGHDELFERSFVDEDSDGKGVMYYDVGVAGDGLRGEKRDWLGNPYNTLDYNPYRKWSADQSSVEAWNTSGANPVLIDGGKHYGHLEVNLVRSVEGDQEFALINFTPVYSFPVVDQNYNLQKVERRVYKDVVNLKVPLRKTSASPVFKDTLTLYLDENGKVTTEASHYLTSGYSAEYEYQFSRDLIYSCADLGIKEVEIKVSESGEVKWTGIVKVSVLDKIAPKVQVKNYTAVVDIVISKQFELKPEFFIQSLSDNCGDDLEVVMTPKALGCNDINYTGPIKVNLLVKDKSGNSTEAVVYLTIETTESKKISLSGPTQGVKGSTVKLTLGSEFDYTVEAWYKGDEQLSTSNDKVLTVNATGVYRARIKSINGCAVFSNAIEVTFEDAAETPVVKDRVELELGDDGKASLKPEQVFTNWPISPEYTVVLSKTVFSCEDLGSISVIVKISDSKGVIQEKVIEVIVRDNSNPVLVTKNAEVIVDLAIGKVELNPEDFIASLADNCGIKEVTLSRQSVGCEDLGKEISIEVRAVDKAGNVSEKLAKVLLKSSNTKPVTISGSTSICSGENQTLTLKSEAAFEVVRWRMNGAEISGATNKTLEIKEGGSYHAIVRYSGGCHFETEKFVVESLAKPSGEILVDGNILRAPEGNFTYQWFRNGDKLAGGTQQKLTVNQMGEFTVELTNEAGCTTRLAAVTMTISGLINTGILVSEELKIYPNPASSEVEIQALGDLEFAENSMSIYNSNGKEVSSSVEVIRQSPRAVTLAIGRLAAGTYLIMTESPDNKVFVGKLVKR